MKKLISNSLVLTLHSSKAKLFILFLLFTSNIYSQKKNSFGIHLGNDRFFAKNEGFTSNNYHIVNENALKFGVFYERNLKNDDQIYLNLNRGTYHNMFISNESGIDYYTRVRNFYWELNGHYNYKLNNNFKAFAGTFVTFYRFHDKYYGQLFVNNVMIQDEINDVTDFNFGLTGGIKYLINPNSKIQFEPYLLFGISALKRDNIVVNNYDINTVSKHSYRNEFAGFGINIKM